MFTLIVKNRDVRALQWLQEISTRDPSFLSEYQNESETEEFVVRLQETLEAPTDDDAYRLIESIATSFSINWQRPTLDESETQQQSSEKVGA